MCARACDRAALFPSPRPPSALCLTVGCFFMLVCLSHPRSLPAHRGRFLVARSFTCRTAFRSRRCSLVCRAVPPSRLRFLAGPASLVVFFSRLSPPHAAMEIISYEYTKQRRDFGLHPSFGDSAPKLESVQANEEESKQWLTSALTTTELDCIPEQAQHEVNTERFLQSMKGTSHTDGAWPAEIKTSEFVDRQRYLRRIMNEPLYWRDVVSLARTAEGILNANNAIDLYEEYFSGTDRDHGSENTSTPPSAKTLCVFRDPNKVKRTATKISWHPDGANKLAVSYSITQFQQMPADMPLHSYIWDVNSPNQPDTKLLPTSPLTALVYNPRSPDHLVGGCYNGLVGFWDLRKGSAPVESSILEHSHHDPVYDVFWIQSRSGNECCSLSTDGQLLWWDIRKLKKGPTDVMLLNGQGADGNDIIYGGTAMEYRSDAGATRFLVGSEQGAVLLADRKAKKDSESSKSIKASFGSLPGQQGHHGPIYAIQRNPFNVKYFMTVGDWTAKVWMEDLKSPLMTTKYDKSYLTSGCWSPTRPGVMFTTKMDGTLDIWDYYHKQNDPTFSTKVSADAGLASIKVQSAGKLVALGSMDGTVTVLQLSRGLYEPQKDEKSIMAATFERELRREKNLEMRYIQRKRDEKEREKKQKEEDKKREAALAANGGSSSGAGIEGEDDAETKEALQKAEVDFYLAIDMGSSANGAAADGAASSSDAQDYQQQNQAQEVEAKAKMDDEDY